MMRIGKASLVLVVILTSACHRRPEGQPSMRGKLETVATALELFKLDHDRFPATLDELLPATNGLGGGALNGYVRPEGLIDSWGQRLDYTAQGDGYELRCAGRDCAFRTSDDIVKTKEK